MTAFLDNFHPDPADPDRRVWRTAKPLLRDAVVACAPYYPEYPRLKVRRPLGSSNDPSSPSARVAGTEVDVLLCSVTDPSGRFQELGWDFIVEHPQQLETSLRRKLFAHHSKSLKQFRDEALPESKELQKYWRTIEDRVKWDAPSAVDHLFKLLAVVLADSGLDDVGFCSFEFQSGWDRDHGLGILMHKDRVLAADGMTQLILGSRESIVSGARCIQEYDLDEGDFSLLTA
jgi:hypothetical protein